MYIVTKQQKQQLIILIGIILAVMIAAAFYFEFIRNTEEAVSVLSMFNDPHQAEESSFSLPLQRP